MRDPLTNILLAFGIVALGTSALWGPPLVATIVDRWIWGKRA